MRTTNPNGTILIVEDEVSYWTHYKRILAPLKFQFETAINPKSAKIKLRDFKPDLILLDLQFEGEDPREGLDFLSQIRDQDKSIKVIVVTGTAERSVALEAVKRGASDFIEKGIGFLDALQFRVKAVFDRLLLERQLQTQQSREIDRIGGYPYAPGQVIVGRSPAMKRIYGLIDRVARISETVLITGESGTGKELIAQAIHYHSQRSEGSWMPLNCASFPAELIEDELFGHRRGAFSGATADRAGAFEAANNGTIFLDEIGEMPMSMQPRLLRVLQEKKIKRIGENQERSVDVRVTAATNRDLESEVKSGNFREDLYYRLNVIPIALPPLRDRAEDVPLLLDYFAVLFCQQFEVQRRFTTEAIDQLIKYDWHGNVREFRSVIQRSILFAEGEEISAQDLDFSTAFGSVSSPINAQQNLIFPTIKSEADVQPYTKVRSAFETRYVGEVLRLTKGNQTRAAQLLGIDRNSIRRILKRGENSHTSDK